MIAVLGDSSS